MTQNAQITISRPGEGRPYDVLGARVAVHSPAGNGSFVVVDHPVPPGYQVPLHAHVDEDEAAYVLDGAITFIDGAGAETVAGPGTFVSLPRGVAHSFANRGSVEARMIVFTCGGTRLESMFGELDGHARAGTLAPPAVAGALAANGVTLLAG